MRKHFAFCSGQRYQFAKTTLVCLLLCSILSSLEVVAQPYQYIAISKPGKTLYLRQGDVLHYRLHDDSETYRGVFEKHLGNVIVVSGAVLATQEIAQIIIPKDARFTSLAHQLGGYAVMGGPLFFTMDIVNPIFRGESMHVSRQNVKISALISGTGLALLSIPGKKRYQVNKPWKMELIESTRVLPRKSRIKLIL